MPKSSFAVRGLSRRAAVLLGVGLATAAGLATASQAAVPATIEKLVQTALAGFASTPTPPPAPPAPVKTDITFVDPLPGHTVDSPFGLRQLPWEDHARLHAGIDIAAPLGTPVAATRDGVISNTGTKAGYGQFVEITHPDGMTSFYAHLSGAAPDVVAGVTVTAGQTLGYVGSTGDSTGPHLHLEMRSGGKALNPARFIGQTFANAAALPLEAAGRIGSAVRIASVSHIPASKLARMGAVRLAATTTTVGGHRRVHMLIPAAG